MEESDSRKWFAGIQRRIDSLPFSVFIVLSTAVAFLVINYFFCPRYAFWQGLSLPATWSYPEINRATDAVEQLKRPFEPIDNPTNDVIRWRLLFPVLCHYLGLPKEFYLALPHIGCLITLGWVAIVIYRESSSRLVTIAATILLGTASWFFISMGWLSYFDSWCTLGLLIYSFHPSRFALLIACLLTPWIDERFVVALPIVFVVRGLYFDRPLWFTDKSLIYDAFTTTAVTLPWIAFRVYLIQTGSDQGPSATTWQVSLDQPGMLVTTLWGWWNGLRMLWIYGIAICVLRFVRNQYWTLACLIAATLLTLILNLRFACDLSRSVSNLIPLAMMGLIETIRTPAFPYRQFLSCLCILNLVLPAYHVITIRTIPIFYFPYQRSLQYELPFEFSAKYHNQRGVEAWMSNDGATSIDLFSAAIRIDSKMSEAYLNRGVVRFATGQLEEAETDIRRAVELTPDLYEGHFQLAQLLVKKGDSTGAINSFQTILRNSPPTFRRRDESEKAIRYLSSAP